MNHEKLKTLTEEEKAEIIRQVNTEVTSIAQEEERTGKIIPVPNAEELVQRAAVALMQSKKFISEILPKMSKKSIHRATLAYLDLPTEDLPVYLKTEEEKLLFAHGQRAIMMRTIIVNHHANIMIQEARAKKLQKEQQQSEVTQDGSEPTTTEG
jgi:hypothetical protein